MEIKRVLLNIAYELEKDSVFVNIDRGGCCWFAGLIAEELEKEKIPFQLVMQNPTNYKHALEDQSNNKGEEMSAEHLYLKVAGFYFDSTGDLDTSDCEDDLHLNWTAEQIKNFYNNGGDSWNSTFEYYLGHRKREIRNIIKSNFKQYGTKDSIRH